MRHPFLGLSAASGVLLACGVGLWSVLGPASSAHAQLIDSMLKAESGVFTIVSERNGAEVFRSKVFFDGPLSRKEKPGGYSIMDGRNGTQLEVATDEQKATLMEIPFFERDRKLAPELMDKYGGGMLGSFRMLLAPANKRLWQQAKEGVSREMLEEDTPDGRSRSGVRVTTPGMTQTLWSDPETGEPGEVVIEIDRLKGMRTVLTDIRFGVAVDPELLSSKPPEGYTVDDRTDEP